MVKTKYDLLIRNGRERYVLVPEADFAAMQELVEDEAAFRALCASKKRQAGSPLIPADQVRHELGLAPRHARRKARALLRGEYMAFDEAKVRKALYRPFVPTFHFFAREFNEDTYQLSRTFPTPESEAENCVIGVPGIGGRAERGSESRRQGLVEVEVGERRRQLVGGDGQHDRHLGEGILRDAVRQELPDVGVAARPGYA